MEIKSPESTEEKIDSNIVSKIKSGQVVTTAIDADRLPFYLVAALATGFKVAKIADEGEDFPRTSTKTGKSGTNEKEYDSDGTPKVIMCKVAGEDRIAVCIEKLASSDSMEGHSPFWRALERLDQENIQPLSKPAPKS